MAPSIKPQFHAGRFQLRDGLGRTSNWAGAQRLALSPDRRWPFLGYSLGTFPQNVSRLPSKRAASTLFINREYKSTEFRKLVGTSDQLAWQPSIQFSPAATKSHAQPPQHVKRAKLARSQKRRQKAPYFWVRLATQNWSQLYEICFRRALLEPFSEPRGQTRGSPRFFCTKNVFPPRSWAQMFSPRLGGGPLPDVRVGLLRGLPERHLLAQGKPGLKRGTRGTRAGRFVVAKSISHQETLE